MISNSKNYLGHKNIPGVYQKVINEIPFCNNFIELFAGSGAISEKLGSVQSKIYLNDIDKDVCKFLINKFPSSIVSNEHFLNALQLFSTLPAATVIFADPPYLHDTRAKNFERYNFEMSVNDHVQLLTTLLEYSHKVLIIHPKCELYESMLKDWRKVEIKIRYNSKTSVEYLYMNFPAEAQLLTSKYLGSDCWERQRIKRKGDKLVQKLLSLPAAERNYLLDRINKM